MRADSLPSNPFRIAMRQVKPSRLRPVQSKLMFVFSGCNVWVAAGLHIGIHANRPRRWLAPASRQSLRLFHYNFELGLRFHVENQYPRASASRVNPIV